MVVKKSFKLLVATGTTPFLAFVSIISVEGCRTLFMNDRYLEVRHNTLKKTQPHLFRLT